MAGQGSEVPAGSRGSQRGTDGAAQMCATGRVQDSGPWIVDSTLDVLDLLFAGLIKVD